MISRIFFKGHFELRNSSSRIRKGNLILDSATTVYLNSKIVPGLTRLSYGGSTSPTNTSDTSLNSLIGAVTRVSTPSISNPTPDYTRLRFKFFINTEVPIIINELAIGTEQGDLFAKTTLETPFFIDSLELGEIDYVLDLHHGITSTPIALPIQNEPPVFVTPFLTSTLNLVTTTTDFFNPNENLDIVVFNTQETSFTAIDSIVYPTIVSVRSPLNRVMISPGVEMLECTIPTTNNFLPRNFNALGVTVRSINNLTMVLKLDRTVSVPFRGELNLVFKKEWNQ